MSFFELESKKGKIEISSKNIINRPAEKAKLLRLGTDFQAYDEWRSQEPSIVDLFRQFPSLRVDSAELAFRLPSLQPRFYSIASCPTYRLGLNTEVLDMKRGTTYLDLLLTVVRYQTPGDNLATFYTQLSACRSQKHKKTVKL